MRSCAARHGRPRRRFQARVTESSPARRTRSAPVRWRLRRRSSSPRLTSRQPRTDDDVRFIIMHRTNAHWEAGAIPDRDLIARVGTLLEGMASAGVLASAEGLRPSSEGVRLDFASGTRTIIPGPLRGNDDLPTGFTIIRARSLDEA